MNVAKQHFLNTLLLLLLFNQFGNAQNLLSNATFTACKPDVTDCSGGGLIDVDLMR